jgi:hypothetical protein
MLRLYASPSEARLKGCGERALPIASGQVVRHAASWERHLSSGVKGGPFRQGGNLRSTGCARSPTRLGQAGQLCRSDSWLTITPPRLCFLQVFIPNGFKFFRINTSISVDSKGLVLHQNCARASPLASADPGEGVHPLSLAKSAELNDSRGFLENSLTKECASP